MPRRVELPLNSAARVIHFLSGVGGWAYPYNQEKTVSFNRAVAFSDGERGGP
jgi:hypothetical protein